MRVTSLRHFSFRTYPSARPVSQLLFSLASPLRSHSRGRFLPARDEAIESDLERQIGARRLIPALLFLASLIRTYVPQGKSVYT